MGIGLFMLFAIILMLSLFLTLFLAPYIAAYRATRNYVADTRIKGCYRLNLVLFLLACYAMLPAIILATSFLVPGVLALLVWEAFSFYCIYPAAKKNFLRKWTVAWSVAYWAVSLLPLGFLAYFAVTLGK